jgi:hypothetical protein
VEIADCGYAQVISQYRDGSLAEQSYDAINDYRHLCSHWKAVVGWLRAIAKILTMRVNCSRIQEIRWFFLLNVAGRVVFAMRVGLVFRVTVELLKKCIELLCEPDKVERVSAS